MTLRKITFLALNLLLGSSLSVLARFKLVIKENNGQIIGGIDCINKRILWAAIALYQLNINENTMWASVASLNKN